LTSAKLSYEQSLKISLINAPIHPITAATYYSLGCVEFERQNLDAAKIWLDKALNIASLRSPARTDGTMARILWKMSKVLESDPYGTNAAEANALLIRAEMARNDLTGKGEGGVIALDDEFKEAAADQEAAYDLLVPGFFR